MGNSFIHSVRSVGLLQKESIDQGEALPLREYMPRAQLYKYIQAENLQKSTPLQAWVLGISFSLLPPFAAASDVANMTVQISAHF